MFGSERKFTAYSGTVLENIRDCTIRDGDNLFYRKKGRRFKSPLGIYFSSKMAEAADYAIWRAYDIERGGWDPRQEFFSEYLKRPRTEGQTPVIITGELSIYRKYFSPLLNYIDIFPVESLFVLEDGVRAIDIIGTPRAERTALFKAVNLQELLQVK